MGHYIPIQWIKLVTLVETCCSMAWYSIVRQTQLTDIGWRNLNLSGELGSSPQKSQTQGRNVRWCEISKSFVYHAKKPSRSGFYTPKTLAHMFSQRSVAQYGVILQGHQTWLARKPSFSLMIFPVIYKPPWLSGILLKMVVGSIDFKCRTIHVYPFVWSVLFLFFPICQVRVSRF